MHARVVRGYVQPGQVDKAIHICNESVVPAAQAQAGFKSLSLLVNRKTGSVIAISYWESEAALRASETSGYFSQQLARFTDIFHPDVLPRGQTYEVGVHL
jgi:heme-degrading monooxygenase HmoA